MLFKRAGAGVAVVLWGVSLAPAATLVRGPYLQNVRGNRATIIWATDENGSGLLQFSPDRTFGRSVSVPASGRPFPVFETAMGAPFYQHRADLVGLSAGTAYFYRVLLDGQEIGPDQRTEFRFRTAGEGPFAFLAFGDSGLGTPEQRQVAERMAQETAPVPAFVLHVGDIAYVSGTFEEFQRRHFPFYRTIMRRAPFFTAPGNHEYITNSAAPYLALHAPPIDDVPIADRGRYYSFDWGNVHFVSLDSNRPLMEAAKGNGPMLQWLDNDLQKTKQTWKVVFFHHTPYPTNRHVDDPNDITAREQIVPIVDKYSVDLVLAGHEHNYQRTLPLRGGQMVAAGQGATYIVTGGGGGTLYEVLPRPFLAYAESAHHYLRAAVQGSRILVRVIRVDGQEIDNFALDAHTPPPVPLVDPPQITLGSAVGGASFSATLAPGMLVSVFGQNLAGRVAPATRLPLPTELAGASLTLNGRRLPLLYVSPTQINAQLPFDTIGSATLRLNTSAGSGEVAVTIAEAAPDIFTAGTDAAILHPDGTFVNAVSPAQAGESVSIFLTGLGEVTGSISAGLAAPAPPLVVRSTVQVEIGAQTVIPSFAGLAPGFAGLYQVNVEVPSGLATGRQRLRVIARGASSNEVSLPVQ